MFDAWGISIFVGFDFHNVDALRLKSRKELLTLLFRKLLILRIYSILFDGIKKLPAEHVEMEKELLLQWMAESQMLVKANVRLNDAAIQVSEWFRKKGFRTCILKGQGNALMYPNPYSRTPGDIDIWVEGEDKRVISFVRSISPHEKACYHHIEFPSYKGVEVEVHYRPSFLLCFWHDRKLQKYYERVKEEQFSHRVMLGEQGEIAIPTVEFNLIFQLTHIFSHLMNEGIGLRQLVDYYYVLCDFYKVYQKSSKITPSLFTLKEGSTSHPDPLTLRGEGGNRPTRCSEPLRSKVGGPSKVFARLCGMGPPGEREFTIFNLQLIVYRLLIMAHGDGLLGGTTIFVPHRSIALRSSPLEWGIFFKYSAFYRREIKSSAVCSVTISTENQRLPKSFRDAPK